MSHTNQKIILVFTDEEIHLQVNSLKEFCKFVISTYAESNEPETFILPNGDEYAWNTEIAWKLIEENIPEMEFLSLL